MAIGSGTAARASSFIACDRVAVLVLLAPKLYLFLLGALYTPLTHFLVVLDLRFRKLTVFPEDDVEAQSEYAKSYKDDSCYQYFHINQ